MMHLKALVIFVFIIGFKQSYAQNDPDILQIFDQFVTSNAVTGICEKPDEETLTHFLANFQMVSVLASKKLKEIYPEYTKDNISRTMKKRSELITQKVNEIVEAKGCTDPDVKIIIKRFYVQAKWKPGQ